MVGEMAEEVEAVVVGAGPAGLAAAAALGGRGVSALVLERSDGVGASWRGRYDRLRLNTARAVSALPGAPIDASCGRWVGRDDFVAYLEDYAGRHGLRVRCGAAVGRIERIKDGWGLQAGGGRVRARSVVVATGFDRVPVVPGWPGREGFSGRLLHASSYRNAGPFRGLEVLVVGLGSTGNEISVDLLEGGARGVRVAVRTPPNILPREWLGLPMSVVARFAGRLPAAVADRAGFAVQRLAFGDLSSHGLPRAPHGIATALRLRGHGICVDYGFVDALKRGRAGVVAAVERFDGGDVVLAGRRGPAEARRRDLRHRVPAGARTPRRAPWRPARRRSPEILWGDARGDQRPALCGLRAPDKRPVARDVGVGPAGGRGGRKGEARGC